MFLKQLNLILGLVVQTGYKKYVFEIRGNEVSK